MHTRCTSRQAGGFTAKHVDQRNARQTGAMGSVRASSCTLILGLTGMMLHHHTAACVLAAQGTSDVQDVTAALPPLMWTGKQPALLACRPLPGGCAGHAGRPQLCRPGAAGGGHASCRLLYVWLPPGREPRLCCRAQPAGARHLAHHQRPGVSVFHWLETRTLCGQHGCVR